MNAPRSRLLLFLFGLAIVHGLIVNLMPVMFTTMDETFHLNKSNQAMLKAYFFGGSALALVFSGYLTQYLGARWMSVILGCVAGAGAVMFGLAPTYPLVLLSAAVLAIGTMPLAAVYASLIATRFSDVRQRVYMWTYAILAISATIATTGLGWLLDVVGDYHIIFIVLGVVIWCWMALLLAASWRALAPVVGPGQEVAVKRMVSRSGGPSHAGGKLHALWQIVGSGVFNRGALYLMMLLMIFDFLCVSNMLAWTPTFFEQLYGGSKTIAGASLSASSFGVAVGRIVMSTFPPGKVSDRMLLAACYTGGVICFGLLVLLEPPYAVSLALMFLAGAFIAAQAPTMGSLAVAKFGQRAPVATPIYEAVGTVAGVVGPPLMGHLADVTGQIRLVLLLVPLAGFALAAIAWGWELYDRRTNVAGTLRVPSAESN